MLETNLQKLVERINSQISPECIERLARETGFLRRASELNPYDFVLLLLTGTSTSSGMTLTSLLDLLTTMPGRTCITKSALSQRICHDSSLKLMKTIYAAVVALKLEKLVQDPFLKGYAANFVDILVADSTTITLNQRLAEHFKGSGGSASKAALKIDHILSAHTLQTLSTTISPASRPDSTFANDILPFVSDGVLVIRDLGYFSTPNLRAIEEKKGFYISRFKQGIVTFDDKGERIPELGKWIDRRLSSKYGLDCNIRIGLQESYRVRLVGIRVPDEVYNQRMRRARETARKNGRQVTDETKRMNRYNVFITNIPAGMVPAEGIVSLYRLRWECELVFKCWKTHFNIDIMQGSNRNRIETLVISRLTTLLLVSSIFAFARLYLARQNGLEASLYRFSAWILIGNRLLRLFVGAPLTDELLRVLNGSPSRISKDQRTRMSTRKRVESKTASYGFNAQTHDFVILSS